MSVTKSNQNNLTSPNGNSLAVFVDINDNALKLKDINGGVEPITNYTGSSSVGLLQLQGGVALSSTLTSVTDQNNTASPLKLSTTSAQFVSPLRISTDDASGFYLDCEDSSTNNRFSIKRDPASQLVTLDFASNPIGSTTSVGAIRTYVDGTNLSEVMTFREDGNVGIGTTTPTTKLVVNSTATALNATFDALSTATILGSQQSPLRVLRTGGQPNIYIGTSNETPDHSAFLAGIRTGAWYNTASPTYSGQFSAYQVNRANQWGTQTSASDLRMAHLFTCNGNNARSALAITPLLAESSTNTDYVAVNNLLVTTAGNFGTQPTARVQIVGDGSTSATTSLLVQNSSGTAALTVRDDLSVLISAAGIFGFGDTTNYAKKSSALDGVEIAGFGGVGLGAFGGINTFVVQSGSASLGATTANASAIFDITSTTKGFLPPRMTNAQRAAIGTPAVGLMVYCTDAVEGLYVYKSTGWTFVI
jgi:hypothetical protein